MKATLSTLVGFLALLSVVAAPVRAEAPQASGEDEALKQRIRGMAEGVDEVPLPLIIDALSGHAVLPWSEQHAMKFAVVAEAVRESINRGGIAAGRVNEAGNIVERHVEEAMEALGFESGHPVAPSGRARSAGYPDLEATLGDAAFYVEVKAFSSRTKDSTQRTFYLSPSSDFKVTRDATHLLIAVELVQAARGLYRAKSVRWLDLSRLKCNLKYEFNASNRDMYAEEAGLVIIER